MTDARRVTAGKQNQASHGTSERRSPEEIASASSKLTTEPFELPARSHPRRAAARPRSPGDQRPADTSMGVRHSRLLRADHQRLLVHALQLPIGELGFTPPWDVSVAGPDAATAAPAPIPRNIGRTPLPLAKARGLIQPATVAGDYAAITVSYRRLYATVLPTTCTRRSSSTPA
jgi:hypothetical protein